MIEPLPSTGISKILSLCELLDDHGGKENLYQLTADLPMPFGELLLVVKGAEMLGLVDTSGDDALLLPVGAQVLKATLAEKKALLKPQLLKLKVFQHIVKLIENSGKQQVPANVVREELAMQLPQEQPRQLFTTLLNWGRYGEVFGYSRDSDLFFLAKPQGQ